MIQVGQVLDKYELLERVGQGGMAVVYRGLDRSLKRVVAVKVLHKHLSEYQEARDRFEREAQAVAKLRHENILEIFDYSGAEAAEAFGSSYIVTEFIDGQTLKQAITERPIAFPEIGAMLVLQVCRALAHAHSVGILHRDVKPENVMIRSDGVVKLMDFGISHMVDLERLTVTGQLLGSPAYMAPEHVEGRPLDFRTDVFAAGIVLYQLTVGRLPFEGKNPHEVLKRIAECRFLDPRQANPRIGNRLGRIILRAMAKEPPDRFPAVGEMVTALESYLDESGISADKVVAELARYFEGPAAYEQALAERLVDHLARRGQELLGRDDRAAALDVFDRVLTIDPDNAKVLALLEGVNRRKRIKTGALVAGFVAVLGTCAFTIHRRSQTAELLPTGPLGGGSWPTQGPAFAAGYEPPPPAPDPDVPAPGDAGPSGPGSAGSAGGPDVTPPPPDAAPAVVAADIRVTVWPPRGSEIRFGEGDWLPVPEGGLVVRSIDRAMTITARNPCCEMGYANVHVGQPTATVDMKLKPGTVVAKCDYPDTTVQIDEKSAQLGKPWSIWFEGTLDSASAKVTFIARDKVDTRAVQVRSGQTTEVRCAF
ncbi:MAG TPA: serine/threonine-protein kinase [Kofleriaceae bacterium]|nr:serine/threonine-protein kinase [Kofleriaceae bacterium]